LRGFDVRTLRVMSGYRTPTYNKAIGNVAYSMHLWGAAADVFVETDFNGDGRIDRHDAEVFAQLVDATDRERDDKPLPAGGLGAYGATAAHGPFVHIDVRPSHARWGG
jgi:uncharacterized protein YcbK (DUF882 family)